MNEFEFNSLEELYKKLLPALNTKVNELKRNYIRHITEKDIWNYLQKKYWKEASKLTLGEMVDDILSIPNHLIEEYMARVTQKRSSQEPKFKEDLL